MLLILFLYPLLILSSHNFNYCNISSSFFNDTSIILYPDPPSIGQSLNIFIYGSSLYTITNGSIIMNIYIEDMLINTTKSNLCTFTSCPIKENYIIIYNDYTIPVYMPTTVIYSIDLLFENIFNINIGCLKIFTQFHNII